MLPRGARVAALAILAGLPAFAQQPQLTAEQAIAFLDKDRDGKCSLNEYLTYQVIRLAQFDADGDGVLQYGEFRESLSGKAKQNAQRSFDAFNTEDDRKALTRREFLGYHAYVFRQFVDTNGDGFMSAAEWTSVVGNS
jgi:Ca2+-binding EF-hand superfamily protein